MSVSKLWSIYIIIKIIMSNWAENPENHRQSLLSYALPSLLFTECQRYCVDSEYQAATTPEQATCLANCQAKTTRAFDLYMAVNVRAAARRDFRHYVDVSRFTGMEVEHKHDTESVISHQHDLHVHPSSIQEFRKETDRQFTQVQSKALN